MHVYKTVFRPHKFGLDSIPAISAIIPPISAISPGISAIVFSIKFHSMTCPGHFQLQISEFGKLN